MRGAAEQPQERERGAPRAADPYHREVAEQPRPQQDLQAPEQEETSPQQETPRQHETSRPQEADEQAQPRREPEEPEAVEAVEAVEEPGAFPELNVPQAVREPAVAWWTAVNRVHEVLLAGDAGLETVSGAFAAELKARWEYAKTLHEHGYHVPEYLAERATIAPLWPLPETPKLVGKLTRAA